MYKEHEHELHCVEKYKKVRNAVLKAISERQWTDQASLIEQVKELQSMFSQRKVKEIFSNIYTKHKVSYSPSPLPCVDLFESIFIFRDCHMLKCVGVGVHTYVCVCVCGKHMRVCAHACLFVCV